MIWKPNINRTQVIKLKHVEKICILLNCTPNDLLVWKADVHIALPDNHSLKALERKPEEEDLYQTLRNLPFKELKNIAGMVRGK